jgi:hypothetical protein
MKKSKEEKSVPDYPFLDVINVKEYMKRYALLKKTCKHVRASYLYLTGF